MKKVKKAQSGSKISSTKLKKVADSLNTVGNQKVNAGIQRTIKSGSDSVSRELVRSGKKDLSNSTRYNTIVKKAVVKKKSGGTMSKCKYGCN